MGGSKRSRKFLFYNIKTKKDKVSLSFCYANFEKICKTHFLNISAFLKQSLRAFFSLFNVWSKKTIKVSSKTISWASLGGAFTLAVHFCTTMRFQRAYIVWSKQGKRMQKPDVATWHYGQKHACYTQRVIF